MSYKEAHTIPTIACSIYVDFTNAEDETSFCTQLDCLNLPYEVQFFPSSNITQVQIAHSDSASYWEFVDAINNMLLPLGSNIPLLREMIDRYHGTCYFDIECHKRETYPAMVFDGQAMSAIRTLGADISIDMYDDL